MAILTPSTAYLSDGLARLLTVDGCNRRPAFIQKSLAVASIDLLGTAYVRLGTCIDGQLRLETRSLIPPAPSVCLCLCFCLCFAIQASLLENVG